MSKVKRTKDFAIIHNTPKGQLLITREPENDDDIITLWIKLESEIGMAKMKMTISDIDVADEVFEAYRDYELAKTAINTALNQEYL